MEIDSTSSARTFILSTQWFYNMYCETLKGTREMQKEMEIYSSAREFLAKQGEDISNLPLTLDSKITQEVTA
jgi:hypothetical protein